MTFSYSNNICGNNQGVNKPEKNESYVNPTGY